ncbi:methylmalonyl Co-A mutase-associated GTPase MeaB [Palleronia sediminis]|uniref:Methylmalonyl Co-A mutase-associated GTPase MeaB n=1 Tax=Palleronia sediminis TaxID=2547833 RepID=A0A4R6AFX4_9RHOB|nr:methylmalonyl Co-A mutase-associated GTPase MeaB [Palleronia sediminis]TDL81338.1 methylmalonyl Co-A mutase-associated GTPase MeaB [Palleronia sediminis]
MTDAELQAGLLGGDRRALARAITLVESARPDHRARAARLLGAVADPSRDTLRLGLSGTPGVGKSTFIERFGLDRVAEGHRVAVLAVDPSSARSGGSILGDKTRMERLARAPAAFIRPSPSQTELGGVARRTREVIALCEAAGFDLIVVETVGVGQSETLVAQMTDIFVLLLAPGGGDELQGVKRGIMEIADLILVNKADGDMRRQAEATRAEYQGALRLLRRRAGDPDGYPAALAVSALDATGMAAAWDAMAALAAHRRASGRFAATRAAQNRHAFEDAVRQGLLRHLTADPGTRDRMAALGRSVAAGQVAPAAAADEILRAILGAAGTGGEGA